MCYLALSQDKQSLGLEQKISDLIFSQVSLLLAFCKYWMDSVLFCQVNNQVGTLRGDSELFVPVEQAGASRHIHQQRLGNRAEP